MTGFVFHKADCVILLFREWTLDTPLAFTLGVLGTFGMGLLTELATYSRRNLISSYPSLRRRPSLFRLLMGVAFTVQVRSTR